MKFLLIATLLAGTEFQIVYPNEQICEKALAKVIEQDPKALCIPAGEDAVDTKFVAFFNTILKFDQLYQKQLTENE
jgi:hypothetical protein